MHPTPRCTGQRLAFVAQGGEQPSLQSGRYQIYVRPFPGPGDKLPISIEGGTEPYWRGDGKEIFYLAPDRNGRHADGNCSSGIVSNECS